MSRFAKVNLADLPPPDIIFQETAQELFEQMRAHSIAESPELAEVLMLESEPATKQLRVGAYFRALDRAELNDRARGLLLATAKGTMLDHLGAPWGVERLIVSPGDPTAVPPIPPVFESDDELRRRIQLAPEALTAGATRGAYLFFALAASGEVRDAEPDSPVPGQVRVTLLSREGDGSAPPALVETVRAYLDNDERRGLNDTVSVQSATIVPYAIEARITLLPGPDATVVLAAINAALAAYIADHHRLGHDIRLSGLYAAIHQKGVHNVTIVSPAADIVIARTEAPFCATAPVISVEGRDV